MLTISHSKTRRCALKYPRATMAKITGIDESRLVEIEHRQVEPWFDEARLIARAMLCSIHDLFTADDLLAFDADPRFYDADLRHWQEGARLPLSIALRLKHRFGLDAVDDLHQPAVARQIWDMLGQGERSGDDRCPWCLATRKPASSTLPAQIDHHAWCLPHNLWGSRATRTRTANSADLPLPARKGHRSGSARVPGLKAVREANFLTQAGMAERLGINANHYARIERCELKLPIAKANLISQLFNVPRDTLFATPETPVDNLT